MGKNQIEYVITRNLVVIFVLFLQYCHPIRRKLPIRKPYYRSCNIKNNDNSSHLVPDSDFAEETR